MSDWRSLAAALADQVAKEVPLDPGWRAAFADTPRHMFVPRFHKDDQHGRPERLVEVGDEPTAETLAAVYSDQALVTQYGVAGVLPDGTEVRAPTSSASMPSVVATMLERLQVADDHRVLEIGTGTGYNAALLAHRLGPERVTTVEVDPKVAEQARHNLASTEVSPTVVTGDGAAGYPPQAPYDRIIATCSVNSIPRAWLEQLAPGGRIVAPLTFGSALAILDADGTGGASGRLDDQMVSFMAMRAHDPGMVVIEQGDGVPFRGLTDVDPRPFDPFSPARDLRLWLSLHLPAVTTSVTCDDDGTPNGLILTKAGSRADVSYAPTDGGLWPVVQWGERRLWDTIEAVWRSWERNGRPDRTRIGITARPDRQWVWLDHPDQALRPATSD